jgi:hypothetical protein
VVASEEYDPNCFNVPFEKVQTEPGNALIIKKWTDFYGRILTPQLKKACSLSEFIFERLDAEIYQEEK